MTHIRIERLGAGRCQEDASQNHKSDFIVGTCQDLDGVHRVDGSPDRQILCHIDGAGNAQKEEPDQHGRTKGRADLAGAGVLHAEQDSQNDQNNCYHIPLVAA